MRFGCLVALLCAGAALAQDPVQVDNRHYSIVFENDRVRVLRIRYGAGEKSVMHEHPDSLAVFLTELNVRFTAPDGSAQELTAKAGEVRWTPAGNHLPENLLPGPMELVLVEMKTRSGGRNSAKEDPVKLSPTLYQVLLENEQVRVLNARYARGDKSALHEHPGTVVVCLTDQQVRYNLASGMVSDATFKAGDVFWNPPTRHQPENLSPSAIAAILVEIKAARGR